MRALHVRRGTQYATGNIIEPGVPLDLMLCCILGGYVNEDQCKPVSRGVNWGDRD